MPDKHNMGPSRFIPKVDGEQWFDRHARRSEKNADNVDVVVKWCKKHCICFEDNEYRLMFGSDTWHFYADGKHAVWSPSTASLVLNGRKGDSLHIHDYKSLLQTLCRYFSVTPPNAFELANYEKKPKKLHWRLRP